MAERKEYMSNNKNLDKGNLIDNKNVPQNINTNKTLGRLINERIPTERVHRSKNTQNSWQNEHDVLYNKENVAERLGISKVFLEKKLTHRDTSREWVIAICAAYGLGPDTDKVLKECNYPTLDASTTREETLLYYLEDFKDKPTTLESINQELLSKNEAPLQIQKRTTKSKPSYHKSNSQYTQINDIILHTYKPEFDIYDSLETEYFPNCTVEASMIISGPKNRFYGLSASSNYKSIDYTYCELTLDDNNNYRYLNNESCIGTKSSIDHPEFGVFFSRLASQVRQEIQRCNDVLFDSRNYKGRFSAKLKNSSIHIFYEEFNYSFPERNEYYLMEYWNGEYKLSIAKKSMFMQEYLTEDEYYDYYHSRDRIERKTYSSINEIEDLASQTNDNLAKNIICNRKSTYIRLQKVLEAKLMDIQSNKIYIRHLRYIWDNPSEVLLYYNIENEFKCEYDNEYGEICYFDTEVNITAENGKEIVVTFDDVCAGFECGFNSFKEICEYKCDHESIYDVLA